MNWENMERDALNENLLKCLIAVSKADDNVSDHEIIYVLKAGLSMGIPKSTITRLWQEPKEKLIIPKSEQERMTILFYLIFVIESDKNISTKEEETIHHYGLKLGFNHLMIDDFLRVVKAKLKDDNEVLDLLKEVKKYLN